MAGRRIRLLDADPSLLPHANPEARRQLTAPLMRIGRGRWTVPEALRLRGDQWLGLLIVEGLMIRTIRVSELECCELVGAGDIIRPWDGGDDLGAIATDVSWRVVQPARVVILDDTLARLACRWPAILSALMERCLLRSRSLAVQLAISQARRADVRLLALFWHLADRWGRVTPDGVLVELEVTHRLLSRLTSLRRPTVSVTLKRLAETGELTRVSKGRWLLRGARPSERQRVLGLPVAA